MLPCKVASPIQQEKRYRGTGGGFTVPPPVLGADSPSLGAHENSLLCERDCKSSFSYFHKIIDVKLFTNLCERSLVTIVHCNNYSQYL